MDSGRVTGTPVAVGIGACVRPACVTTGRRLWKSWIASSTRASSAHRPKRVADPLRPTRNTLRCCSMHVTVAAVAAHPARRHVFGLDRGDLVAGDLAERRALVDAI